jgi:hypothetical protein
MSKSSFEWRENNDVNSVILVSKCSRLPAKELSKAMATNFTSRAASQVLDF